MFCVGDDQVVGRRAFLSCPSVFSRVAVSTNERNIFKSPLLVDIFAPPFISDGVCVSGLQR